MMAKLTKKQHRELVQILQHADRALKFLSRPDVKVAVTADQATTTLHYTSPQGEHLYPIDKEIGSDLCGLSMGLSALASFIERNSQP